MIRNVKMVVLSVMIISGFCGSVARAAGADSPQEKAFMEKREAQSQQFYKNLHLTDDQKKSLEANKNNHREQMKAMFQQMREKKTAIGQELQKDALNMERISQIQNELKALQAQMLDQKLQGVLEVRKILTPEQFKKFMTNMEEQRSRFSHKWEGSKGGF